MKVSTSVDCVACNIALKAHVARGDLQSAASMLTTMMRDPAKRDGLPLPDVVSFNTVINGLAQGMVPAKAEALLIAMIDFGLCPPTSGTYASVVAAFARSSNPVSAEKWLSRMLETTSPTTESASEVVGFNATMLAYANANDATGALRVLSKFQTRARDECPNAAPDVISYNTVMSACAKANQPAQVCQVPRVAAAPSTGGPYLVPPAALQLSSSVPAQLRFPFAAALLALSLHSSLTRARLLPALALFRTGGEDLHPDDQSRHHAQRHLLLVRDPRACHVGQRRKGPGVAR